MNRYLISSLIVAISLGVVLMALILGMDASAQDVDEHTLFDPIVTADSGSERPMDGSDGAAENRFFAPLDETTEAVDNAANTATADSRFSIRGYLQHQFAYSTQNKSDEFDFSRPKPGIRKSRTTVNIEIEGALSDRVLYRMGAGGYYDFHYLGSAGDEVSDAERDELEDEIELRDTYLNVELIDNWWLKLGRQTIAWGEAEYSQIMDLANPRDEREFGFVDLEDARIPVLATRLSYVGERWGADIALIQEHRPSKLAPRGSDFDPLIRVPSAIDIGIDEPDVSLTDPEFLGRLFFSFPAGDLSLIYADVYDDVPVVGPRTDGGAGLTLSYPRIKAVGLSANLITGSWLFKTELGYKDGQRLALDTAPGEAPSTIERPLYQAMVGVEYAGISDLSLSVEGRVNHIGDYEQQLAASRNDAFVAARVGYTFWRERANVGVVVGHWFENESDSVRITSSYDIADDLELSAGYITYDARDDQGLLHPYRDSDRVVVGMRYSF